MEQTNNLSFKTLLSKQTNTTLQDAGIGALIPTPPSRSPDAHILHSPPPSSPSEMHHPLTPTIPFVVRRISLPTQILTRRFFIFLVLVVALK